MLIFFGPEIINYILLSHRITKAWQKRGKKLLPHDMKFFRSNQSIFLQLYANYLEKNCKHKI